MAHELAHIHHMNHGPDFQKLNLKLRSEIEALQARGYHGPGFWSSGRRLTDSSKALGDGQLVASDLPQYTCGGSKEKGSRRRVYRPKTTTKTKATRSKDWPDQFSSTGNKLESASDSFFRKRTNTVQARKTRADLAESRIRGTEATSKVKIPKQMDAREARAHAAELRVGSSTRNSKTKPSVESKSTNLASTKQASTSSSSKPSGSSSKLNSNSKGKAKNDSDVEEIEVIVLESDWEDFEPSSSKIHSAENIEAEKTLLRDEMNDLLKGYQSQPKTKSSTLGKQNDDDDIEVLDFERIGKSKRKIEVSDDPAKKVPRLTLKSPVPIPSTSTKPVPTQVPMHTSSSDTTSVACSWTCNICFTDNHADFARCSFCARPKGLPPPDWM